MSDHYAIRRYHRQTMPVLGANRKKKYMKLLLVLLIAGVAGAAYLVSSSGILADGSSRIPEQMISRINLERQANNLAPVQLDDALAGRALATSREMKMSSLAHAPVGDSSADDATNMFVIPKISWAISGYDTQQQMFEALANDDPSFRASVLNGGYTNAGIGVTSDSYNYYIVVKWQ